MTEKTARQIEGMKSQTFGVEIEMNGITRQNAAKLAAEFFGTGRYENTAWKNGYMTWSAYDQPGREWKFSRDVSIAGPDDQKCELVTPVLTIGDLEDFLILDLVSIVGELLKFMSLFVIDHLYTFGDLIEFAVCFRSQSLITKHIFHHVSELTAFDFQHVDRGIERQTFL